jgi:hypothetical protein
VTGPEGVLIYGAGGYKFVVLDVARSLARTERARRYRGPCRSSRPLRSCRDGNRRAIMATHDAEEAEVT